MRGRYVLEGVRMLRAWIGGIAGLIIVLFGIMLLINVASVPGVQSLGAAGDVLNVFVGLLGVVVGLAAAYLFSSQQGDVEILKFVQDRVTPYVRQSLLIVESLMAYMTMSHRVLPHISDGIQASAGMSSGLTVDERRERAVEEIKRELLDAGIDPEKFLQEFRASATSFAEYLKTMGRDTYMNSIADRHLEKSIGPLAYLEKMAPDDAETMRKDWADSHIYNVADHIETAAGSTDFMDLLDAYVNVPQHYKPSDFIGHLIMPYYFILEKPLETKAGLIHGYIFNLGAAYLMTAYQVLPKHDVIKKAFNEVFAGRSRLSDSYLAFSKPDAVQFTYPGWREGFDDVLNNLNTLILVVTDEGFNEYYDPSVHGAIPRTGYRIF